MEEVHGEMNAVQLSSLDGQVAWLRRAGAEHEGIEFLQKIVAGEIPPPPIAVLMGFDVTKVEPGFAVFECDPGEHLYNPIGVVHGGLACTLLDSAMSCAIQTTVPHHGPLDCLVALRAPCNDGYVLFDLNVP